VLSEEISGILSVDVDKVEDPEVGGRLQLAHLEKRNRELVEQLQAQKDTLHQYEAQILSQTSHLQMAENALEQERHQKEQTLQLETTKMKGDLSSNALALQMLVSEKSDLEQVRVERRQMSQC
jgi:hypothetical protein